MGVVEQALSYLQNRQTLVEGWVSQATGGSYTMLEKGGGTRTRGRSLAQ